jgi:hypothetical protein
MFWEQYITSAFKDDDDAKQEIDNKMDAVCSSKTSGDSTEPYSISIQKIFKLNHD